MTFKPTNLISPNPQKQPVYSSLQLLQLLLPCSSDFHRVEQPPHSVVSEFGFIDFVRPPDSILHILGLLFLFQWRSRDTPRNRPCKPAPSTSPHCHPRAPLHALHHPQRARSHVHVSSSSPPLRPSPCARRLQAPRRRTMQLSRLKNACSTISSRWTRFCITFLSS